MNQNMGVCVKQQKQKEVTAGLGCPTAVATSAERAKQKAVADEGR
jgi:hypothetical protein